MFKKFFLFCLTFFIATLYFLPVETKAAATLQKVGVNNLGLIGYWSFNGPDMTNGVARDRSGQGNNGNLTNIATSTFYIVGKLGQALSFDGNDDYLSTKNTVNIATVTISAWIKIPSTPSTQQTVIGFANGFNNGVNDKVLYVDTARKLRFYVFDGSTKTTSAPSSALPLDTWVHVVGTADGTNAYTYVNGVQVGSVAAGNTYTSYSVANIFLGAPINSGSWTYFKGNLDESRVYNRALTAAEVKQLYLAGSAKFNTTVPTKLNSGLVGYWTLDGKDTVWTSATAATTLDRSGRGLTGTLTFLERAFAPSVGKIGQAITFNNTSSYINLPEVYSPGTGDMTVSAWINDRGLKLQGIYSDFSVAGSSFVFLRLSTSNTLNFLTQDGTNQASITGNTVMALNTWYHVVGVKTGNTVSVYVNGVSDATPVTNSSQGAVVIDDGNPPSIGRQSNSNVQFFNGMIDDVRVYNRALTAAEIKQLYQAGNTKFNTNISTKYNDGLTGYWRFDGADTVWTSDTVATTLDKSGNGNTGTLTNMAKATSPTVGKIGQGLFFDGTDDYIPLSDTAALSPGSNNFSISAWFNTADPAVTQAIYSNFGTTAFILLRVSGTARFLSSDDASQGGNAVGATTLLPGIWYHVVGIRNGVSTYVYLNGVLDGTGGTNLGTLTITGNTPPAIGRQNNAGSQYFVGKIDEIRIYNRALSLNEIKQLYLAGR